MKTNGPLFLYFRWSSYVQHLSVLSKTSSHCTSNFRSWAAYSFTRASSLPSMPSTCFRASTDRSLSTMAPASAIVSRSTAALEAFTSSARLCILRRSCSICSRTGISRLEARVCVPSSRTSAGNTNASLGLVYVERCSDQCAFAWLGIGFCVFSNSRGISPLLADGLVGFSSCHPVCRWPCDSFSRFSISHARSCRSCKTLREWPTIVQCMCYRGSHGIGQREDGTSCITR